MNHIRTLNGWIALDSNQEKYAGIISDIAKRWHFTVPLMTFLSWYGSVGGSPDTLAAELAKGKTPQAIVKEVQQAKSQPASAPATQPTTQPDTSNMNGIDAAFKSKVVAILQDLTAKGWQPHVAEGLRTVEQQQQKVKGGFSKTMNSQHLKGLAVDIVDKRFGWGGEAANLNHQFWNDLGEAAKKQGLTWGGDWKFKDVAHVEEPRQATTAPASQPSAKAKTPHKKAPSVKSKSKVPAKAKPPGKAPKHRKSSITDVLLQRIAKQDSQFRWSYKFSSAL